jgi:hypothetical protein
MSRTLSLAAALMMAALALAVSGCGGDDEPEASGVDAWAESFCSAVGDWRDTLEELRNQFTGDPASFANEEALKDAVETVSSATDELVSELRELGAPETESGEAVRSSIESLADTVDTQKANVDQAVSGISGIADIPAAMTAVGTALTTMANSLQDTLDAIETADSSGELENAFQQADACTELTG